MDSQITVERVEPPVDCGTVRHVDQLSDRERRCLRRLLGDDGSNSVDPQAVTALVGYDAIKTTEYVSVTTAFADDARSTAGSTI